MTIIIIAVIILACVPAYRSLITGIETYRPLIAPACLAIADLLVALVFTWLLEIGKVLLDQSMHFAIFGVLLSFAALGMLLRREFRGVRVSGITASVFLSWAIWFMFITLH